MANLSEYYPNPIIAGTTAGTYADGGSAAFRDRTLPFTADQIFSTTNNTAPNQTAASGSSLMTRDLVQLEKLLNTTPIHTGSFTQQAVSGTGASITATAPNLRLDAASTTGFGAITAFYNADLRAGDLSGLSPNFASVNFAASNFIFTFNISSAGNGAVFSPSAQSFGIVLGAFNSTPTDVLASLFPASGAASPRGYIGLRCVNGNVTILAQNGTANSVESATLDTITGAFSRAYALVKSGTSLQLYSGRTLLGSVANFPTTALSASIYVNHSASAVASSTQSRLYFKDSFITT